ncbi:MAG: hypothetical protein OEU26_34370, partial [Candidatus Tectomicrobia bacterium]|nr:hypothetical protein [Candidatus Tectomicrobia bacterium]
VLSAWTKVPLTISPEEIYKFVCVQVLSVSFFLNDHSKIARVGFWHSWSVELAAETRPGSRT